MEEKADTVRLGVLMVSAFYSSSSINSIILETLHFSSLHNWLTVFVEMLLPF